MAMVKRGEYLYIAYDKDGLPYAVADTVSDLSRMTGASRRTITETLSKKRYDKFGKVRNEGGSDK